MESSDLERLQPAIDRKLGRLGNSSPWHHAWLRLSPASTPEERLRVCQAIRDAGTFSEDAGYFLVCWAAEHVAEEQDTGQAPLLILNLFEAVRASERRFAALLERSGEAAMADLFRSDPAEHDRRREAGRLFFFGPVKHEPAEKPGWLDRLLPAIANGVVAAIPVDFLAYRCDPGQAVRVIHILLAGQGVGGRRREVAGVVQQDRRLRLVCLAGGGE